MSGAKYVKRYIELFLGRSSYDNPRENKSGHVPGARLSLVFLDHSSNTLRNHHITWRKVAVQLADEFATHK